MRPETTSFEGHTCIRLEGAGSTMLVTTSVGPRIIGLFAADGDGSDNIMAVVPDATLERANGAAFRLYGGHRLWTAPEEAAVTYEPDDRPCSVIDSADGVRVEAPRDGAGFVKTLEIHAAGPHWLIDHELRNGSDQPRTVAPWAITQVRPGGTATLPLGKRLPGSQADRSLVLWPYTDLDDARLRFTREGVAVDAVPGDGPVKVGAAPGLGLLTYRFETQVFEKRVDVRPSQPHADRGAAVQVYVRDDFCELETLGPLVPLAPGEATTHRETWSLHGVSA